MIASTMLSIRIAPRAGLRKRWTLQSAFMRRDTRRLSTEPPHKDEEFAKIPAETEPTVKAEDTLSMPEGTMTEITRDSDGLASPKPPKITLQFLPGTSNPLAMQRAIDSKRNKLLGGTSANKYPRLETPDSNIQSNIAEIKSKYAYLKPGDKLPHATAMIRGRIRSSRRASSKLAFWDIVHNDDVFQVVLNYNVIGGDFPDFLSLMSFRDGDIVSTTGFIGRTDMGELSLIATSLPKVLAPCLHNLPSGIEDPEKRFRNRHVDLLTRPMARQTLRLRSDIIQHIRNFLLDKGFLEVQTPILADSVGGAVAGPFLTTSSIFKDRLLALRIAPELWLKKLVIGGLEKVFEIGTQFRNENADTIHNPEFTSLEFYQAYVGLEDLIFMTESMLSGLARHVDKLIRNKYKKLPTLGELFIPPFNRIEFIPALERAIGRSLPNLDDDKLATLGMRILYSDIGLDLPNHPTLPRLLDRLSAIYLEPQCQRPTFITHQPECLSPLAKTSVRGGRRVSERVELFVRGKEIVNAYEEENSPSQQRRKFAQQQHWRNGEKSSFAERREGRISESLADEAYAAALEWGLPPTGGFGMGIDRLCMLFSGASRISEVLTFGGLRAVVGQHVMLPGINAMKLERDIAKKEEGIQKRSAKAQVQKIAPNKTQRDTSVSSDSTNTTHRTQENSTLVPAISESTIEPTPEMSMTPQNVQSVIASDAMLPETNTGNSMGATSEETPHANTVALETDKISTVPISNNNPDREQHGLLTVTESALSQVKDITCGFGQLGTFPLTEPTQAQVQHIISGSGPDGALKEATAATAAFENGTVTAMEQMSNNNSDLEQQPTSAESVPSQVERIKCDLEPESALETRGL